MRVRTAMHGTGGRALPASVSVEDVINSVTVVVHPENGKGVASVHLDPEAARMLAARLNTWADYLDGERMGPRPKSAVR